jgi:hypothetical protein
VGDYKANIKKRFMGFKINEQSDTKLRCDSNNFFDPSKINSVPANKKIIPVNAGYASDPTRNKQPKGKVQKQPNQIKPSNNGAV